MMGAAMGTAVLAGCGSTSGAPERPLPNGYRYIRLFGTGDTLPGIGTAEFIPPSVKIHDRQQIIFHAGDTVGRSDDGVNMGLYEIVMDYGTSIPRMAGLNKIVRQGDRLPDGRTVSQVQLADLNANGSVAVRLLTADEKGLSIYMDRNRVNGASAGGLQRVLGFLSATPDPDFMFGATLGNFDLFADDDLLVASHWAEVNGAITGESIFYLPGGVVDSRGSRLLSAGDSIAGTDQQINKIGLINANNGGSYAAQLHTGVIFSNTLSSMAAGSSSGSAIVQGSVFDPGAARASLMAVSASTTLSTAAAAAQVLTASALNHGPRLDPDGNVAILVPISENVERLILGRRAIVTTGEITPTGMVIDGIGGPVLDANGLIYFVARNGDVDELLVSNGARVVSLLKTGTPLFDAGGPALATIAFGYAREQVDSQGRLVFVGEFDDGSLSVILGIPL